MIKTTNILLDELKDYASPKTKISRMVGKGELFPIVKGLYETDKTVSPHLLAGSIYGPSYISFEYALSYYGLIPETVYTVTCASFGKRKRKDYHTPFGNYSFRDIPQKAYPLDLSLLREGDYWFWIAKPEKALCDMLYSLSPLPNLTALSRLLLEDLRIEEEALRKLNLQDIEILAAAYHSTNVNKLLSFLRRLSNESSH